MGQLNDEANRLAHDIETQLTAMVQAGESVLKVRTKARELVNELGLPELHVEHPLIVYAPGGGYALRVQVMNGEPFPLATALVPVPEQWAKDEP